MRECQYSVKDDDLSNVCGERVCVCACVCIGGEGVYMCECVCVRVSEAVNGVFKSIRVYGLLQLIEG